MAVKAGPTGTLIACSDVSGAYRSLDRGRNWNVIGSAHGLEHTHVSSVGFDPADSAIIYLGAEEGLYRSENHGEMFTKVLSGGYWGDIAVSAANPDRAYAAFHPLWDGLDGQIYRSTDHGLHWTRTSIDLPANLRIVRLVPDPSNANIIYLVSGKHRFAMGAEELWRSSDGGVHWLKIGPPGPIHDVTIDPLSSSTLFVAVAGQGTYKSIDGASTWSLSTSEWGRLFAKSSTVIRMLQAIGNSGVVLETNNAGATWTPKSQSASWNPGWQPGWHWGDNGSSGYAGADMSDSDAYFWVNPQFVYGSFDGGSEFHALHTRETSLGSGRWTSTGADNTEVYAVALSEAAPNLVFAGLWDMGLWRSLDRGATWESCNQGDFGWVGGRGGDSPTVLADPLRATVVWAAHGQRGSHSHLMKSVEAGAPGTWMPMSEGLPPAAMAVEYGGLSLARTSPANNRTLFVAGEGRVYRSADDGNTWLEVLAASGLRTTAVDHFDADIVFAGGDTGIWRSLDGGNTGTWTQVGLPEITGVWDIKCDPTASGRTYAVCHGTDKGIYRSSDNGSIWERIWNNDFARSIAIHALNGDLLFATSSANSCCGASPAGSAGVVRSNDGGITWTPMNDGLAWPFAWPVAIDSSGHWLFIGAPGTGFHRRLISSLFPAQDNLPCLVRFALGISPYDPGHAGRLSHEIAGDGGQNYLTFTYTRPEPPPANIIYSVQGNSDLSAGSWSTGGLTEIGSTVNTGLRTITIRDSASISGGGSRFMRLRVSQTE